MVNFTKFAVAQKLVVDQRLLSTREVHRSSVRTQHAIEDPTYSHTDVSAVRAALSASSSALQFPVIPHLPGAQMSLIME